MIRRIFAMSHSKIDQALLDEIRSMHWFHSIDLGNGVITPGDVSPETLAAMAEVIFSEPIEGKSVIDIGCWDGYFSIEAAKGGEERSRHG
jgi:tRNA (mo5U34)-methyltransferase